MGFPAKSSPRAAQYDRTRSTSLSGLPEMAASRRISQATVACLTAVSSRAGQALASASRSASGRQATEDDTTLKPVSASAATALLTSRPSRDVLAARAARWPRAAFPDATAAANSAVPAMSASISDRRRSSSPGRSRPSGPADWMSRRWGIAASRPGTEPCERDWISRICSSAGALSATVRLSSSQGGSNRDASRLNSAADSSQSGSI